MPTKPVAVTVVAETWITARPALEAAEKGEKGDSDRAPPERQRMFWPTPDVGLVRFLATTGARAEDP